MQCPQWNNKAQNKQEINISQPLTLQRWAQGGDDNKQLKQNLHRNQHKTETTKGVQQRLVQCKTHLQGWTMCCCITRKELTNETCGINCVNNHHPLLYPQSELIKALDKWAQDSFLRRRPCLRGSTAWSRPCTEVHSNNEQYLHSSTPMMNLYQWIYKATLSQRFRSIMNHHQHSLKLSLAITFLLCWSWLRYLVSDDIPTSMKTYKHCFV